MWFTAIKGICNASDNDLANELPTKREPINPGPCVKAIAESCSFFIFALRNAASITGTKPEETPEETPPADLKPGDVFGVTSAPADQRVTLSWQPSTDDKGIKNYKIYYGLSAANLSMTVQTQDNKTTWYIPNLQNGSEYFFAVAAIDTTGQESENKSSLVSGIPYSSEPILYIPPETTPPEQIRPTAPAMQATGPEIIWFVLASIFISKLYFKKKGKVC